MYYAHVIVPRLLRFYTCRCLVGYTSLCTNGTQAISIVSLLFLQICLVQPAASPLLTSNPASMEIGQLLALLSQSLVLLALARNLVTTGSKARLAKQIHAFEHAMPPPVGPLDVAGPSNATPMPLSVNVDQTPVPATGFSEVQITQQACGLTTTPRFGRRIVAFSSNPTTTTSFGSRPNWVAKCGHGQPRDPSFYRSRRTWCRFFFNTWFQPPTSQSCWNAWHFCS